MYLQTKYTKKIEFCTYLPEGTQQRQGVSFLVGSTVTGEK